MDWTYKILFVIIACEGGKKMFDLHFHENPNIKKELRFIMTQIDDLRSLLQQQNEVISTETSEIKTKIDTLEAKITELGGNQMPDITDILNDVRTSISNIEGISGTEEKPQETTPMGTTPTETDGGNGIGTGTGTAEETTVTDNTDSTETSETTPTTSPNESGDGF